MNPESPVLVSIEHFRCLTATFRQFFFLSLCLSNSLEVFTPSSSMHWFTILIICDDKWCSCSHVRLTQIGIYLRKFYGAQANLINQYLCCVNIVAYLLHKHFPFVQFFIVHLEPERHFVCGVTHAVCIFLFCLTLSLAVSECFGLDQHEIKRNKKKKEEN